MSFDEIMDTMSELKDGKTAGDDRVPTKFFKYAPLDLLEVIHRIFERMWNDESVVDCLNRSLVWPIRKKEDNSLVQNYRGISFGNSIAKVFVSVLHNRLREWVEMNDRLDKF